MVRIFGVNLGRKKEPRQATNLTASFKEEDAELKVILREIRVVYSALSYIMETDKSKADLALSLLRDLLKEGDLPRADDLRAILESMDRQKEKFEREHREHRRGLFRRGPVESFNVAKESPSEYQNLIGICIELVESAKRHDTRVMAIADDLRGRENAKRLPYDLKTDIVFLRKMYLIESGSLINSLNSLVRLLNTFQTGREASYFSRTIRRDLSLIISEIEKIFKIKGQVEARLGIKI